MKKNNQIKNALSLFVPILLSGTINYVSAQTFNFTTAGAIGASGPIQSQLNTAYAATNLNGLVTSVGGIQQWTVPTSGLYTITSAGAGGGDGYYSAGGSGIVISSEVTLTAGQVLNIVVGQVGITTGNVSQYDQYYGGSGGGGSFVYTGSIGNAGLILAAGGGGGGLTSTANIIGSNNSNGNYGTSGSSITDAGGFVAQGGISGNGGGFSDRSYLSGGPGAGWVSDYNPTYGGDYPTMGGTRFNGGNASTYGRNGGFGGGGASGNNNSGFNYPYYVFSGGAGGYSGGAAGHNGGNADGQVGGGGGSFLSGANQTNVGLNSGDGYITITHICISPTIPLFSSSSLTNCGTQVTALSIAAGSLNDASDWQWYIGTCGGVSAGSGTSINVSPAATTTYYARGEGGCVTADSCDSITITVNPIITNALNPILCAGHSITIGSNTYTVTNTYIDTLTSLVTGCDSVITTNLTVLPANIFTQAPTLCAGQSITVGNNIYTTSNTYIDTVTSIVSGCDSIVTTNLTVLPANTFTQSPVVCAGHSITVGGATHSANGNYTDVLTSLITGCDSTVTTNLTVIGTINTTTNVSGVTITANQTGAVYKWLNCNTGYSIIAGATSQTYTATANGTYAVLVKIGNCSDTSACVSISNVGINESDLKAQFVIFPNPFTSQTTISFSEEQKKSTVKILDVLGKEVKIAVLNGAKNLTIERSDMKSGIYFVQVIDENKNVVNTKIVIQ